MQVVLEERTTEQDSSSFRAVLFGVKGLAVEGGGLFSKRAVYEHFAFGRRVLSL